jgi:hypothetical protein
MEGNYNEAIDNLKPIIPRLESSTSFFIFKSIKRNTKILPAWFLVIIAILLAVTFTVLDIKIALLLLFLVLCNTLVAPRISKNEFFQEYLKGL